LPLSGTFNSEGCNLTVMKERKNMGSESSIRTVFFLFFF
jgi:hypothetical protein